MRGAKGSSVSPFTPFVVTVYLDMIFCTSSYTPGAQSVITSYSIHYTKLYDFKQWLETLNYQPHSVKLNYWNVQEFFTYLEQNQTNHLKDFKSEQITGYLNYLQHRPNCITSGALSAGTINKHITTLRLLSKYLQLTGKANISIKPELLKAPETATYLSKQEIQAVITSYSIHYTKLYECCCKSCISLSFN